MTCPRTAGRRVSTTQARLLRRADRPRSRPRAILIPLPPHQGPVTLTFDLHNRHTYSEEQVKANRAYARYTAVIGALTMDNTLISRAAIQSEFRNGLGSGRADRRRRRPRRDSRRSRRPARSDHDHDSGAENQVSLLGEKLTSTRPTARPPISPRPPDRHRQQCDIDRIPAPASGLPGDRTSR